MPLTEVSDAYGRRALEYIANHGAIGNAEEADRTLIASWAGTVRGRIIDVGSGPGQWTNFLHQAGADVEGVEPVLTFVEDARRRYPNVSYEIGRAEHLRVSDASVGGILAWFSLIHIEPDQIGVVFAEFARCLQPDGSLVVGFFEGPRLAPFDHAVTTAYFWPVGLLSQVIEEAGFTVTVSHTRTDPGSRSQGAIVARGALH